MRWLFVLLILLLPNKALACGGCHEPSAFTNAVLFADPASYKVVYTGLGGLLLDEYVRFVSGKWADDIELHYNYGSIDAFEMNRRYRELNNYRQDYGSNPDNLYVLPSFLIQNIPALEDYILNNALIGS